MSGTVTVEAFSTCRLPIEDRLIDHKFGMTFAPPVLTLSIATDTEIGHTAWMFLKLHSIRTSRVNGAVTNRVVISRSLTLLFESQ